MPSKEASSPVTTAPKIEEITLKGELAEEELDCLKQPCKKITLVSVFGRVGGSFNRHRRLLVSGDTLFKGVESLSMPSCDLGDESITRIGELSMIRELNLSGSQITDEGIRIISKLPHLEKLNLSMNKITDEGMAIINRSMPNLTYLDVSLNEKVSDVGVEPFLHSTKLTTLVIECNNITREKAQELKAHINKVVYFPGKKVRPPEIMMEW
ncbi:MAG: leucine-rich repeat domain-containing protein [Candidatus Paracaedibacteraceae bacterium]|nr:leucine-rich repeat domain-containing protein [Candidatus Paracaedibacteraceae bacterium]